MGFCKARSCLYGGGCRYVCIFLFIRGAEKFWEPLDQRMSSVFFSLLFHHYFQCGLRLFAIVNISFNVHGSIQEHCLVKSPFPQNNLVCHLSCHPGISQVMKVKNATVIHPEEPIEEQSLPVPPSQTPISSVSSKLTHQSTI